MKFFDKDLDLGQKQIGKYSCSVKYVKRFRFKWFATQLNTYIFVREQDEVTKKEIEDFSDECFKYASKLKNGWPRGLQAGFGSIAILKSQLIHQDAIDYCKTFSKKHWAAFEIPVVCDSSSKKYYKNNDKKLWGAVYYSFLRDLIKQTLS
jgi:hypothetical protein